MFPKLTFLLFAFLLSFACQAQNLHLPEAKPFKVSGIDIAAAAGYTVAGALWGAREAYHADPTVFERKWGVSPNSFLGSNAWLSEQYNPDGTHKPEVGNNIRDGWHGLGLASRSLWVGATFAVSFRGGMKWKKEKWWHVPVKLAGMGLLSVTTSNLAYRYFRNA